MQLRNTSLDAKNTPSGDAALGEMSANDPRAADRASSITGRINPTNSAHSRSQPSQLSQPSNAASDAAPHLPDPEGETTSLETVRGAVRSLSAGDHSASYFYMYAMLQDLYRQIMAGQTQLQRESTKAGIDARVREVDHTRHQIAAQNTSAKINFVGSMATASVALVPPIIWPIQKGNVMGQVLSQAANYMGQSTISLLDRNSKTLGGSYLANIDAIKLKVDAIETQTANAASEAGRSGVDQTKEDIRAGMQAILGYLQRQSDFIDRITR